MFFFYEHRVYSSTYCRHEANILKVNKEGSKKTQGQDTGKEDYGDKGQSITALSKNIPKLTFPQALTPSRRRWACRSRARPTR